MSKAHRIAPLAALAAVTALMLTGCGAAGGATSSSNGLTISISSTRQFDVVEDSSINYPAGEKGCVFDVVLENTSAEAIKLVGASITGTTDLGSSEDGAGVDLRSLVPADLASKGLFNDVVDDGIEAGQKIEFTDAYLCSATDVEMSVFNQDNDNLVAVKLN